MEIIIVISLVIFFFCLGFRIGWNRVRNPFISEEKEKEPMGFKLRK